MKLRTVFIGVALIALVLAGCGGDDDTSAQVEYCEAGQSLGSNVTALSGLVVGDDPGQVMDSVVEGSDDLESAIDAVEGELDALQKAATDVVADEVDALEQAVDDLNDALSELLGSDLSVENATAAQDAFQGVETAAQAVYTTLTDCP